MGYHAIDCSSKGYAGAGSHETARVCSNDTECRCNNGCAEGYDGYSLECLKSGESPKLNTIYGIEENKCGTDPKRILQSRVSKDLCTDPWCQKKGDDRN